MIKASELRIGNYVTTKPGHYKEQKILSISSLSLGHIQGESGNEIYSVYEEHSEPIPLTKEWLEKLGFHSGAVGGFNWYWHKKFREEDFCINLKPYGNFYFCRNNEHNSSFATKHYVHELQNLYFALTGEELTIQS